MKRKQVVISESTLLAVDICQQMVNQAVGSSFKILSADISFSESVIQKEKETIKVSVDFRVYNKQLERCKDLSVNAEYLTEFILCSFNKGGWYLPFGEELVLTKRPDSAATFMLCPIFVGIRLKKGFD